MKAHTMPQRIADAAAVTSLSGSGAAMYFGLTPGEWQVVGIVGGLLVAVIGAVANLVITWHFKQKHLELAELAMKAGLND